MAAQATLCLQPRSTGDARPCVTPQPSAAVPLLHRRFQSCEELKQGAAATHRYRCRSTWRLSSVRASVLKPFEEFNRADEASRASRDRRFKDKAPDLPSPGQFQQTLKVSFTVGGLGLHTAEYVYVRVRPAFAGEGRYFVRVPDGTNSDLFRLIDNSVDREVDAGNPNEEPVNPEAENTQVQLFLEWLRLQDAEGYEGTFDDFVGSEYRRRFSEPLDRYLDEMEPPEEIVARAEDEPFLAASLDNLSLESPLYSTLVSGDVRVQGAEHLLSALEMLGVDNARIEIEGGSEIPIVDGSALGWVIDVQSAGTRRAVKPGAKEGMMSRRAPVLHEPLLVLGDGGAFISFVPGDRQLLSTGVDHTDEATIIGRQFFSWAAGGASEADHYRWKVAPARNYIPSVKAAVEQAKAGLAMGGSRDCSVVGYGDRWYDPGMVRFFDDEPARHKMVDLTGDLSLLAKHGGGGVPNGHVLAYKADHELHAKFLREFAAKATYES